jgi:hypothetical protein
MPEAVVNFIALLGWSAPGGETSAVLSMKDSIQQVQYIKAFEFQDLTDALSSHSILSLEPTRL